jgi:sugar transferase (PEP-CTERM/EpsH1 system associated)
MHPYSVPSLLQVAPRFCQPPTSGAEYRCLYLAAQLSRHMAVTHVGFRPAGAPPPTIPDSPSHRFIGVPRPGSYRVQDLVAGVFGSVPFTVRNYTRPAMSGVLERLLREQHFDIAVLEGVHLGGYLTLLRSAECRPAVVCDWHNVESEILRRYSLAARGPLRKFYARMAAGRLERYERWFVNQCDMHVVVSERDREALVHRYGASVPVVVIENGVPLDYFSAAGKDVGERPPFRVLFSGAMDYHANVEAVSWFGSEVWPAVHAAAPQAVFTIVGRNPAPEVRALAGRPGIEVTGTVPDVRPYYREASVAVVPLRVGGGTRIKILEAMAAGVPVISTALGAEGLAAEPSRHYVLADSVEQMRSSLLSLLQNPHEGARLTDAARDLIRRRYDWAALGDDLAGHLMGLASRYRHAAQTVE